MPPGTLAAFTTLAMAGCGEEGGAELTVKLTCTTTELEPAADTEMVPVYVPDVRPEGFTETEAAVPDVGETLNHGTLAAALQLTVPPPVIAMASALTRSAPHLLG